MFVRIPSLIIVPYSIKLFLQSKINSQAPYGWPPASLPLNLSFSSLGLLHQHLQVYQTGSYTSIGIYWEVCGGGKALHWAGVRRLTDT